MMKIIKNYVLKILDEYLNGYKKNNESTGYNPLEKIRGALFHWVSVPFNGTDVWCQLRCPNDTQIEQCGDISNISFDKDKDMNYDDLITIRNYQENLCRVTFNNPHFDNIGSLVGKYDFVVKQKRKELEEITARYEAEKNKLSEAEKRDIDTKIKVLNLHLGYILPSDTMAFITKWATGNDVSDIKKLSKKTLLRAACLAKSHNKAPSDYISGVFTDHNKKDIDAHAILIFDEFLKEQETVNKSKFQWFGGKKRVDDNGLLPERGK